MLEERLARNAQPRERYHNMMERQKVTRLTGHSARETENFLRAELSRELLTRHELDMTEQLETACQGRGAGKPLRILIRH